MLFHPLLDNGYTTLLGSGRRLHCLVTGNNAPLGPDGELNMINLPNGKLPPLARHKEELTGSVFNFTISWLQYDDGIYRLEATNIPGAPFNIVGQEEFTVGQVGMLWVRFQ